MRLDCFSQEHMNSTTSTKPQQSCSAVLESHQEFPILNPQQSFHSLLCPEHKSLFQTNTAQSICNKWRVSQHGGCICTWRISLFQRIQHPQQGGRPAEPLVPFVTMEWALGETQDTQESGQLIPMEMKDLRLPSQVCSCQTQVVLALEMFRGWTVQSVVPGDPSLAWGDMEDFKQGSRKSMCFAANMQICKSPQAVNELIPNLVQEKEKQLLPRVLQLPCNQDFNAQTRKSSEKKGSPQASFLMQGWVLYMEKGLENFLEDVPLCCRTESWRSCWSQARSCRVPSAPELLWHLQPKGIRQDQVWQIHPELWDSSGCKDFRIFLVNWSIGITQWCWSCLLGSGVVKMIN